MAKRKEPCDVVIAHAPKDVALAREIADGCRANGLETAIDSELLAGPKADHVLREALVESRALIIILSPSGLTTWMTLEIGAIGVGFKPIFIIITDPSATRVPPWLARVPRYTVGRLQEIINEIKLNAQELTEEDRAFLAELPAKMGVSIDELAQEPERLEGLAKGFKRARGKAVSGEH